MCHLQSVWWRVISGQIMINSPRPGSACGGRERSDSSRVRKSRRVSAPALFSLGLNRTGVCVAVVCCGKENRKRAEKCDNSEFLFFEAMWKCPQKIHFCCYPVMFHCGASELFPHRRKKVFSFTPSLLCQRNPQPFQSRLMCPTASERTAAGLAASCMPPIMRASKRYKRRL